MRKDINEEDKSRLIAICNNVENDFKNSPVPIENVEDFFIWRDNIKLSIEEKLKNTAKEKDTEYKRCLRNNIIEEEIKGNKSLELLYDWSKFYRIIRRSKGKLRFINDQYGIEDNDHVIKATSLLHSHLVGQGKANTKDLFDIFQIREINLGELDAQYLLLVETPSNKVNYMLNNMENIILTIPTKNAPSWMVEEIQSSNNNK